MSCSTYRLALWLFARRACCVILPDRIAAARRDVDLRAHCVNRMHDQVIGET